MYKIYGIVMEQLQKFEQRLQGVFRVFNLASKQISRRSDEDHIKKIFASHYLNDAEVTELFSCLANAYNIKELFFFSQFPFDMKECSDYFYNCYISFLIGYELLQTEIQEWLSKNHKKA